MLLMLSACGDAPKPNIATEQMPAAQNLQDQPVLHVELQDVVDTYVLGSNRTDLQRDAKSAKLIGAIVSWRLKVYDIAKEGDRYRVISELMDGSEAGAFGKFVVVAFIAPKDESDVELLLKLQTGHEIQILGRVDGVTARTALVLSPAELVR